MIMKNAKCVELINCKDCGYFLEHTNFKYDIIEYECLCCNKSYQKEFDGNLKK